MKIVKQIITLSMVICMGMAICVNTFAGEKSSSSVSPDYTQKGSVTVDICSTDTKSPIPGGTVTLYQVAAARFLNGKNTFVLTDGFQESGADLKSINESEAGAEELAASLESYVKNRKLSGKSVAADEKGQAKWSNLELGLYLIINTAPAKGYDPVNVFLITVPRYLDGDYIYNVQAKPKVSTANTAKDKTPVPTAASKPSSGGGRLPQTGQLWWPVPVLAFAGMLFMMFGWYRRRHYGKNSDVR